MMQCVVRYLRGDLGTLFPVVVLGLTGGNLDSAYYQPFEGRVAHRSLEGRGNEYTLAPPEG